MYHDRHDRTGETVEKFLDEIANPPPRHSEKEGHYEEDFSLHTFSEGLSLNTGKRRSSPKIGPNWTPLHPGITTSQYYCVFWNRAQPPGGSVRTESAPHSFASEHSFLCRIDVAIIISNHFLDLT